MIEHARGIPLKLGMASWDETAGANGTGEADAGAQAVDVSNEATSTEAGGEIDESASSCVSMDGACRPVDNVELERPSLA